MGSSVRGWQGWAEGTGRWRGSRGGAEGRFVRVSSTEPRTGQQTTIAVLNGLIELDGFLIECAAEFDPPCEVVRLA